MALNLHHFGLKSPIHGNPYSMEDMKLSPHEMDLISSSRRCGSNEDIGSSDEMDHLEYDRDRRSSSPSSVSACSSSPDGGNHNNTNNNRKNSSLDYRTPMSRLNNQQQQRQIFPQSHRAGGKQNENIMSMYEDSPLDFSTKRPKVISKKEVHEGSISPIDDPDSPCSKLRHRLIMKNAESMGITSADALNLTKISPRSMADSPDWTSPKGNNGGANLSYNNMSGSLTSPTGYSSVYNIHSPMISPIITPTGIPGMGVGMPQQMFVPLGVTATSAGSPGLPFSTGLQHHQPNLSNNNGKGSARSTRPFKAYPKDPLAFPTMGLYGLSLGSGTQVQDPGYEKFQNEMLKQVSMTRNKKNGKKSGGGGNNCPVSDSTASSTSPSGYETMDLAELSNSGSDICQDGDGSGGRHKSGDQTKDEAYWERRRKNNEAAKRSRDARRKKEDQIAIRCAYLEQENFTLRFELHELHKKYQHLNQSIPQQ